MLTNFYITPVTSSAERSSWQHALYVRKTNWHGRRQESWWVEGSKYNLHMYFNCLKLCPPPHSHTAYTSSLYKACLPWDLPSPSPPPPHWFYRNYLILSAMFILYLPIQGLSTTWFQAYWHNTNLFATYSSYWRFDFEGTYTMSATIKLGALLYLFYCTLKVSSGTYPW